MASPAMNDILQYVVWRDRKAKESVEPKRSGRGGKISGLKSYLPC